MVVGLRVVEVFEGEVGDEAHDVVRHLAGLGLDVHVVCPPAAAQSFGEVAVTPLAVGAGVTTLAALRRLLGTDTPARVDVVHAHGLRAGLAATLGRAPGTPLVLSWSEPAAAAGAAWLVGRALTRTVVPAATLVLAATPELAEAAQRLGAGEVLVVAPVLPAPQEATRTAAQVREELALPEQGPIVLARARLQEESRLDVLIDASVGWRRPGGAQVVLVGVGPAYRQLVAQATTTRAPVTFAGERDGPAGTEEGEERAGLADLLAAADVAVVTDLRAQPEFALRGVQAGVPVVVPDGGLLRELLAGAVEAFPAGDAQALAATVQKLLYEPPDDRLAARRLVADWPDAARAAQELHSHYERVTRATPPPA